LMQRERMAQAPVFSSAFPLTARRPQPKQISAWEKPARPAQTARFGVGSRVFHEKFGPGTVMAVEDDRLDIDFDKSGSKRVLDRFVEPV